MVSNIAFRSGETTGGVGDRKIESAKQETTGGVGARNNKDSIFTVDNELKQDTICFKGDTYYKQKKKTPITNVILGTLGVAAATIGLLGFAHKYNWLNNINNGKYKQYTDAVTEPCFKACKWLKNNSYDKISAYINKKK